MEPAAILAAAVTVLCGLPPACQTLLRHLPDPQRLGVRIGGLTLAAVVLRTVPVSAQLPPPPLRWQPLSEDEPAEETDPLTTPAESPADTYRVQTGDSLWAIASRLLAQRGVEPTDREVDSYWRRIYQASREVVGGDPDLIFPGQILTIPGP